MMSVLSLKHPVHTLDNRLLFPAGTEVTTENIDVLISSSATASQKYCNLLSNDFVKSDPLTLTERGSLEHHAAAGFVLLSYYFQDFQNIGAITARDHHERKDGSGYPCGTLLDDYMVEIVAVSDVYDALISQRPYRPVSYENRTALEEITEMAEKNQKSNRLGGCQGTDSP